MAVSLENVINRITINAKKASLQLQSVSEKQINRALLAMARYLKSETIALQRANKKDLSAARKKGRVRFKDRGIIQAPVTDTEP